MRIRLSPSGKFADVPASADFATTYSAGWSTASGSIAMPVNDTCVALPVAPFFSFETYQPSDAWRPGTGVSFRCLRGGVWNMKAQMSLSKTVALQSIFLLIDLSSRIGTSIFLPTLPILASTIQLGSAAITFSRSMTLATGDEVCILAQRDTAAAGNVATRGPIVFTASPGRGLL